MVKVRTEQLQRAHSKITDDGKDLHISGQPGIGKTAFLTNLQEYFSDKYTIEEKTVRIHHDREDLERDLLHLARRAAVERDAKPNQLVSVSGGVGPVSGGGTVDDRARDLHKLEDLTRGWSGDPLILCIDDIHKISDQPQVVREFILELSAALGDDVHLITVGQVSGFASATNLEEFHLNLYTEEETRHFLNEEFGELPDETIKKVHTAAEGHPLYLGLLTETSEEETDFHLPEDAVLDTIEERYIEGLPRETVQFLRQVAPLPELDEKTCSGIIDDLSPTEVDEILRKLNRRVIVQEMGRTDDGDKIYKIHQRFRKFLERKHRNTTTIHRKAFQYHIQEVVETLRTAKENSLETSLPHTFYAKYHLQQIYNDELTPEHFRDELNRLDLSYPVRGIIVVYTGFSVFSIGVVDLWQQEFDRVSNWIYDEASNEPVADFFVQLLEWGLSQFSDDPLELADVQIEGSFEDLPVESQPINDMEFSKEHTQRLQNCLQYTVGFFLMDEPYQSKQHRQQALTLLDMYGISLGVLKELKTCVKEVLLNSNLGEDFEELLEEYFETVSQELEGNLNSRLDFYYLRNQSMEFGRELFDNIHYQLLLNSGVLEEIAIEGGTVLEEAENPVFAMMWYSLFTAYLRNHSPESEAFEQAKGRFLKQLEARRSYEQDIEVPLIKAEETAERLELEDSERATEDSASQESDS